ncbi:MAG: glycerol-3-phosphate 1-O-acyltransferase PlsY [Clostridia bacterium]|nr:glycerol-3-phosphate 1-O-acyltransferase PlsY [Clostridia bacterium]
MLDFIQKGLLYTLYGEFIPQNIFVICVVLCVFVPYLLGSFNAAVFVSKHIYKEDVREKGSGNAGLTNMKRNYGFKGALLVFVGDGLKTLLSILFAGLLFGMQYVSVGFSLNSFGYLAAFCCTIGHIFPLFYRMKGGKGVLCTGISAVVLCPVVALVLLVVFLGVLLLTKYVSLSSMIAAAMYPFILNRLMSLFCGVAPDGLMTLTTIITGVLVFFCHRENIKRLMNKTESKIKWGSKK